MNYSWTDDMGMHTATGIYPKDTDIHYFVDKGNAVFNAKIYGKCKNIEKSISVPIYIDRIPPSIWTSTGYDNLRWGWHSNAYVYTGASDSHSGIDWIDGTKIVSGYGVNKIFSQAVSRQACDNAGNCNFATTNVSHISSTDAFRTLSTGCSANNPEYNAMYNDLIDAWSQWDKQVIAVDGISASTRNLSSYPDGAFNVYYTDNEVEKMTKDKIKVNKKYYGKYQNFLVDVNSNNNRDGVIAYSRNWYAKVSLKSVGGRYTGWLGNDYIKCI